MTTPSKNSSREFKDTQFQRLRQYFSVITTSRRKAAEDTGIYAPTVCRRVSELKRNGIIEVVRRDVCPVSGEFVEFLAVKGGCHE